VCSSDLHALVRAVDGNPPTDNVPFSKRLGSRHLQTPERPVEELIFRFDRDPRRNLLVESNDQRPIVRREQFNGSEVILPLFALDERLELAKSMRLKESLSSHPLTQLPGIEQRVIGRILIISLADLQ